MLSRLLKTLGRKMACTCLNTLFGIFDFDIGLCQVKAEEKIVQPCSRRQTVSTFSTFQHGKLRSRLPKCNGRRWMSSLQGELAAYQQPPTKAPWCHKIQVFGGFPVISQQAPLTPVFCQVTRLPSGMRVASQYTPDVVPPCLILNTPQ